MADDIIYVQPLRALSRPGGKGVTDLITESLIIVFVEQPLASPGSANHIYRKVSSRRNNRKTKPLNIQPNIPVYFNPISLGGGKNLPSLS